MTDLAKRALRPFAKSIDDYTLDDIVRQVDVVLEVHDAEVALGLARRICKGVKAGEFGFDQAKLAALYAMADTLRKSAPTAGDRDRLAKAANALRGTSGGSEGGMPLDLRDRATVAVRSYENADDPVAKAAAERELRRLHDDMLARGALAKAFGEPKLMGAAA